MPNTLKWSLQQNQDSLMVTFSGDLTRYSLQPLWLQRAALFSPLATQHCQAVYWDLGRLNRIDSAGFALLVELLHQAQTLAPHFLINPPQAVISLAKLANLHDWLSPFLIHDNKQK